MQRDYTDFNLEKVIDVSSIISIHYFEFSDSFVDTLESHAPWELVYVDRGECTIVADDKTFPLSQGELYFHKPFESHMLKFTKGVASNIFIVTFTSESEAMRYFENRKILASMSTKQYISAIIHEASNTFDLPFNSPDMMGLKLKENDALWGGAQSVFIRLELMLIDIIRDNNYYVSKPKRFYPKDIIADDFVLKIISYMESKLYGKITMNELAREFSFGKTYISKYFIRITGHSIINYFTIMKVNEAKRLIRETSHNFSEISEMLMFTNSHYFSTVFRKYTDMSPSQYKKSCRKN